MTVFLHFLGLFVDTGWMGAYDSSSNTDTSRILLVGDIRKAFLDADAVRQLPCEVYTNMPDAIVVAAKNRFRAIGVVMLGLSAKLSSALKALREVNSGAKIILLAQMYEEPIAIQLAGASSKGTGMADDYLICPIQADRFYKSITDSRFATTGKTASPPAQGRSGTGIAAPAVVDATIESRIKQLEKLATEDDLTGMKNRRYIWEFSRQIIEHTRKEGGRVTLLLFDIDNLKSYNDAYGHLAGDEILKQVALLMRYCCRSHDVVGRVGGDEFAVVFWDEPKRKVAETEAERRSAMADHPKEAIFIAKRFRKELNKAELHLLGPRGKGELTISGGLASFPRDGSTVQQLFSQADKALLDAKRSGKNRIYLVGKPPSDIADVE